MTPSDDPIRRAVDAAAAGAPHPPDFMVISERAARRRRSAQRRARLAGAAAVTVALVAGGVALTHRSDRNDVEVVLDVTTMAAPSSTLPAEPAVTVVPPTPIGPAGPRDGLASKGHPITVTPDTGLADGEAVTVGGSQFPPNRSLGVVMCAASATGGGGVNHCDIGQFGSVTTDAEGSFTTTFTARRFISTQSLGPVDCFTTDCIIAAGALDDYDESGGYAVRFAGNEPVPEAPVLAIDPPSGLRDGQVVRVTLSGGTLSEPSVASLAVADATDRSVQSPLSSYEQSSTDFSAPISARLPGRSGPIDCRERVGRCVLVVAGGEPAAMRAKPVPLAFDAAAPLRPVPELSVTPSTGLRPWQQVTVTATGDGTEDGWEPMVCVPDLAAGCRMLASTTLDRTSITGSIPRYVNGVDCAAVRCVVELRGSSPQLLLARPVAVNFDASIPGVPDALVADGSGSVGTVRGSGLRPGDEVTAQWCDQSGCPVSAKRTAGSDGTVTIQLPRPTAAAADGGSWSLQAFDDDGAPQSGPAQPR